MKLSKLKQSCLGNMFITIFCTVLCAIPTFSITGGEMAKRGEFPFQVQLYYKGKFTCGGSILSPFTVATGAHCFWRYGKLVDVGEMSVVGGSLKKFDNFVVDRIPRVIQIRNVSSYIEHPEFNSTTLDNDLAIVVVDKAFIFSQNVGNIHIPKSNENFDNSNATVGHGGSNISLTTTHLLKFHLSYGNENTCEEDEDENKKDISKQHCIKTETGVGPCPGDSGGPLICYRNNKNGSILVLCGIVSHGSFKRNVPPEKLKCRSTDMEIFTRIQSFLQWIKWKVSSVEASMRCDSEHFYCFSSRKCIKRSKLCDRVSDCEEEEDELECQNYNACKGLEFRCSNGNCLEEKDICDLTIDCGGVFYNGTLLSSSDKEKCPKVENEMCKLNEHDCGVNDRCIKFELKCDGIPDCKNLSDENDCGEENASAIRPCFSSVFEELSGNLVLWLKATVVLLVLNFTMLVILFLQKFIKYLKTASYKKNVIPLKSDPNLEEEIL